MAGSTGPNSRMEKMVNKVNSTEPKDSKKRRKREKEVEKYTTKSGDVKKEKTIDVYKKGEKEI